MKVIYGVEAYLAPDNTAVVTNPKGQDIDTTYCVLDLETTGFSAITEKITEIGIMKYKDGEVIDEFSCFVNPEKHIPERVTEVTNITDDMVKDAETIDKVFPKVLEFIKDSVLVAHNASFDMGFLKQNAKVLGYEFDYTYLDTLSLAKDLFPDYKKYKLGKIAENLGIKVEVAHRALDDVDTTVKVFRVMLDMLKKRGAKKVEDIENVSQTEETKKEAYKKLKTYHAIILAKNYIGSATFLVADTPDNGYIEITILSDPIEYPSKPNKYISVGTWANPPIYDHDYNFVNRQPDGYEEAPDIDYSNGWNLPTPLSGASASFIYASTDSILRIENPKISASQYCWNYIKFKVNEASADNPAIVTVEAEVSSESNYDYLGCWVTQTTTKPAKKSTTGALFNISGIIAKKEYTYEITSAGTYYLHYAYEKDGSTDRNEDIGKIYRIVLPQPQNNTSGARIKYNNLWKPLKDTKLKIDGTWKGASKIYVKINDKWVPQIDSTYFEIENLVSPYWWESLTVSGTGASKNIIDCVINGKKHSKVVSIQTGSSTATVTIPSIRQVKPTEVFVSIAANNQTGTGIQSIQGVNDGGYYAFSMSGDVTCPTYSYNNTQFNLRQYYIADNGDGESDAQIRIKISENSTVTLAAPVLIDMSNYENSKTYNTTSGGTFYNLLKTIDGDYEFDGIRYL